MKSALILPFNPGTSGVCNPAGTPGVTGIAGRAGIFQQSPRKMNCLLRVFLHSTLGFLLEDPDLQFWWLRQKGESKFVPLVSNLTHHIQNQGREQWRLLSSRRDS